MLKVIFKDEYYKKYNLTILFLELFFVLYPLLVNWLSLSEFRIMQCPFKRITGKDCPYCGGTRTLYAVLHLNFHSLLNIRVLILGIFVVLNIIMRLYSVCTKYKDIAVIRIIDYISAFIVALYIITTNLLFMLNNMNTFIG